VFHKIQNIKVKAKPKEVKKKKKKKKKFKIKKKKYFFMLDFSIIFLIKENKIKNFFFFF